MSYSVTVTERITIDGTQTSNSQTFTAGGRASVSEAIPANSTDLLVNFALDVSACNALYLVADVNMTVETNATDHAGGNVINLLAGIPYVFYTGKYDTFKLTADVTKLYITNTTAGTLTIEALYDATP